MSFDSANAFDRSMSQKPQSLTSSIRCNVDWRQLFDDELDDTLRESIEHHAESCAHCQNAMTEFSSMKPKWWKDACDSWLEEELPMSRDPFSTLVAIEIGRDLPEDSPLELERVSLSFLTAPTHPELLGRLGRYDIERVIGTGGMGIVLKAYDSELHRIVAVKVLAQHLASNVSARRRFAREAQAAAAVLHPNVIPIYNVEIDVDTPYLVMQCVNGCSLQSRVDEKGPLSVAEALRIAKQTAAGLYAAHQQGLVHRDVKPANILLEENVDRVLLSDFGLARAVDDASLTRTGVVAGTPHYMSPEQARGDGIQCASDQYSLGCVLYFMFTGHPPFRAQNAMGVLNRICHDHHRPLQQLNETVPREVSLLVDKLLAKSPLDRFASMLEVENGIDQLLVALQTGGLTIQTSPLHSTKPNTAAKWSVFPVAWMVQRAQALIKVEISKSLVGVSLLFLTAVLLGFIVPKWISHGFVGDARSQNDLTVRELERIQREFVVDQSVLSNWDLEIEQLRRQLLELQSSFPESNISSDFNQFHRDVFQIELAIEQMQNPDVWSFFMPKGPEENKSIDDAPSENALDSIDPDDNSDSKETQSSLLLKNLNPISI